MFLSVRPSIFALPEVGFPGSPPPSRQPLALFPPNTAGEVLTDGGRIKRRCCNHIFKLHSLSACLTFPLSGPTGHLSKPAAAPPRSAALNTRHLGLAINTPNGHHMWQCGAGTHQVRHGVPPRPGTGEEVGIKYPNCCN